MSREEERHQMVENQLVRRGITDQRIMEAMRTVPRHLFVPGESEHYAYHDSPLPIGEGQTISQPYMVALMSQELELKGDETVLEIGTGSGYQTAVLAELVQTVFTIERIADLRSRAEKVLLGLGYTNIQFKTADGTYGWPEQGPFDGIIVTAGAPEIIQPLVDQLKEGGKLVIPIGPRYSQTLCCLKKLHGHIEKKIATLCVFVPLIGDYGWKENEEL